MGREYDSRNRKKSWREIDKARESKSQSGRDDYQDKREEKRQHSTVYQNYKSDLEKVFSGGDVPDYMKENLPVGDAQSESQLKLIGAVKRSSSDVELKAAMEAYLKKHTDFPEDFDLFLRVLDYSDEQVQLTVLRQLDQIASEKPIPHKRQFKLKIDSISLLADDDDLRELAEELLPRLR